LQITRLEMKAMRRCGRSSENPSCRATSNSARASISLSLRGLFQVLDQRELALLGIEIVTVTCQFQEVGPGVQAFDLFAKGVVLFIQAMAFFALLIQFFLEILDSIPGTFEPLLERTNLRIEFLERGLFLLVDGDMFLSWRGSWSSGIGRRVAHAHHLPEPRLFI
jgi:hypothetical protein